MTTRTVLSSLVLGILTLAIRPVLSARRQCYYPDLSQADPTQQPCNMEADVSWCCGSDAVCLSNGYCLQTTLFSNRIGRGSCTDPTWSSDSCPKYCSDVQSQTAVSLYLAYDENNGAFCCGASYDIETQTCQNATQGSNQPFSLPAGAVIFNRTDGSPLTYDMSFANSTLNNSSPAATVTVASHGQGSTVSTVTVTAAATNKDHSNTTAVAAGIAVPLGVLLIASLVACGFIYSQLRRLRRAQAVPPKESDSQRPDMIGVHSSSIPNHTPATLAAPAYSQTDYNHPASSSPRHGQNSRQGWQQDALNSRSWHRPNQQHIAEPDSVNVLEAPENNDPVELKAGEDRAAAELRDVSNDGLHYTVVN